MITTINNVIEDLKALMGADVRQFGQPITLENGYDEAEINTIKMLEALALYEAEFFDEDNRDEFVEWLAEEAEEISSNNTYNWGANTRNHLNWTAYKCCGETYIVMMVQRGYGDVRGNYTDDIILRFDYYERFLEELMDASYTAFERDGLVFTTNILAEGWDVWDETNDAEVTVYGCDVEDLLAEAKEVLNK